MIEKLYIHHQSHIPTAPTWNLCGWRTYNQSTPSRANAIASLSTTNVSSAGFPFDFDNAAGLRHWHDSAVRNANGDWTGIGGRSGSRGLEDVAWICGRSGHGDSGEEGQGEVSKLHDDCCSDLGCSSWEVWLIVLMRIELMWSRTAYLYFQRRPLHLPYLRFSMSSCEYSPVSTVWLLLASETIATGASSWG